MINIIGISFRNVSALLKWKIKLIQSFGLYEVIFLRVFIDDNY